MDQRPWTEEGTGRGRRKGHRAVDGERGTRDVDGRRGIGVVDGGRGLGAVDGEYSP